MTLRHADWDYSLKGGPRYPRIINDNCYVVYKVALDDAQRRDVYHFEVIDLTGRVTYRSRKDNLFAPDVNPHKVMAFIEMRAAR